MIAAIIGISSGILIVLFIRILKMLNKPTLYALILSGIGFLYVGFTWMDTTSLIVNSVQAIVFLFLAYFGIRKNIYFLITGFFLHGSWDILYNLLPGSRLIPPHYDLFCMSLDFTIGIYLIVFNSSAVNQHRSPGSGLLSI